MSSFVDKMMSKSLSRLLLVLATLLAAACLLGTPARSEIDDEHKAKSLAVLNYVTGWSLDSAGYHPAVYMLLENTSGRDLTGVPIKMQGKFTDVHTLEPSTAKLEFRRSLKPHQQFPIALVAPRDYELPQNTNHWPVMECKAMMRVGSVGDEGTEYLLVTRVDSTTETQDTAFQKLNELTSYNRTSPATGTHHDRPPAKTGDERGHAVSKPLVARAESLKPPPQVVPKSGDIFSVKPLPALGDDFYSFEKSFGIPTSIDAKKKDFTWAKYRHVASGLELFVGSRERTGKVDLIAFVVPRASVKSDQALVEQCKLFIGAHAPKISPPVRSVRYLPGGRQELLTAAGPGLKILSMALPDSPDRPASFLAIVSRLGQDPDELLRSRKSTSDVLKTLPLGDDAN